MFKEWLEKLNLMDKVVMISMVIAWVFLISTSSYASVTESVTSTEGKDRHHLHEHTYEDVDTDTNTHRTSDHERVQFEIGTDLIIKRGDNGKELYLPVTYNTTTEETVIGVRARITIGELLGWLNPFNWF